MLYCINYIIYVMLYINYIIIYIYMLSTGNALFPVTLRGGHS